MVRDPGEPHVGDIHKSQHRQNHHHIKSERHQRVPAPAFPEHPKNRPRRCHHRPRQEIPQPRRLEFPARIDRHQLRRRHQVPQVEKQRLPRHRHPRPHSPDWNILPRNRLHLLEVKRHQPQQERHRKKRHQPPPLPPPHTPAAPPQVKHRRHRKHHHRTLRQHRRQKKSQRGQIQLPPPPLRLPARLHPHGKKSPRRKEQRHRQRVLLLRDPRHRRHTHRMHRENQPRHPAPLHPHFSQRPPEHQRPRRMHRQRHQAVSIRHLQKQTPLHPQRRDRQRKIIRRRRVEPNILQTLRRMDVGISIKQRIVIHQPPPGPRVPINPRARRHNQPHLHPAPPILGNFAHHAALPRPRPSPKEKGGTGIHP